MLLCLKRNKIQHNSEAKAKAHAKHLFDLNGKVLTAYLCPYCQYWHVGHAMNEMKQRELERQYRG